MLLSGTWPVSMVTLGICALPGYCFSYTLPVSFFCLHKREREREKRPEICSARRCRAHVKHSSSPHLLPIGCLSDRLVLFRAHMNLPFTKSVHLAQYRQLGQAAALRSHRQEKVFFSDSLNCRCRGLHLRPLARHAGVLP